ncbi:CubicO group peptidase (beta-lactamase class C family) [Salisediminibacterium halotolerans]|nr:CubicO group peptidase (beta-lactamase class C family) [Actinophytocola xinjiangensis]RPE87887.1 CubicO group peptidase (beta-lactamase class C family) [Salisediminibacterium halotolerans]TWG37916.1 CubicO group peptidase (beta-lactamase class C family) [Salisediminibacterium halotolerans]
MIPAEMILFMNIGNKGATCMIHSFQQGSPEDIGIPTERFEALEDQLKKSGVETFTLCRRGIVGYQYENHRGIIDQKHKINSVTKSVLSSLVGIALEQGRLRSLDEPVSEILANAANAPSELTVRHLLTMTSGLSRKQWEAYTEEELPLSAIWSGVPSGEPGEKMIYNNADSQLLSAVIEARTNMSLQAFADQYLFQPLGITDYSWETDHNGITLGGYGLYLSAADLMRYGSVLMNRGRRNDTEVIPESWLETAFHSHTNTDKPGQSYGFHWWINEGGNGKQPRLVYAAGRGGKFLILEPVSGVTAVITSVLPQRKSLHPFQWFLRYIVPEIK